MKERLKVVIVALSLRLTRRPTLSKVPTEEDLAALYDGTLRSERRKEVLSALVTSPETYAQWLDFLESAEYLGMTPATLDILAQSEQSGMSRVWHNVLCNLKKALTSYSVYSGLAITALLLLFVGQISSVSPTSALYEKFSGHEAPTSNLPIKSMKQLENQMQLEQVLILDGYNEGLVALGLLKELNAGESSASKARATTSNIEQKHVALYKEVGKWMAIAELHCKREGATHFFDEAHDVILEIGSRIEAVPGEFAGKFVEKLQAVPVEESLQKEQVCSLVRFLK